MNSEAVVENSARSDLVRDLTHRDISPLLGKYFLPKLYFITKA
jgi:hypothetical protein